MKDEPLAMIPYYFPYFLYFSRRFHELERCGHIIKIREIASRYVENRVLSVRLTIYKEYKKNIVRNVERIYSLYIVNTFLFLRRRKQRGDLH